MGAGKSREVSSVTEEFPGPAAPAAERVLSLPQDRSGAAPRLRSRHGLSSTRPDGRWCRSWPCMRMGSWTACSFCPRAPSQVPLGLATMGPEARGTGLGPQRGPCCSVCPLQLDGQPPGPLGHASSCQPRTAGGLFPWAWTRPLLPEGVGQPF